MDYAVLSEQIDQKSVLFLNSLLVGDILRDKILGSLGENAFLRGFPIFFSLAVLWFSNNDQKRRARISAGLFAGCLAVILSVFLQQQVYIHTRPFLDEALHLKLYKPMIVLGWDRLSSFPSDTAVLFFSICTIVFMELPVLGSITFLWSLFTIGLMRVLIGYHYPSDILGGLVLGTGCVLFIARNKYAVGFFQTLLNQFRSTEYIVHALFCIGLAEAYNLFPGLQSIAKGVWMIGKFLIGLL